jgi:hypothetical protein
MRPDLQPKDPLSQVVFIHDYVQLVFQDSGFSLYNVVSYQLNGLTIRQGQSGFCDAVVGLIDQTAVANALEDSQLVIRFANGASIHCPSSGPDVRGPEAWQFNSVGGQAVIEQNV